MATFPLQFIENETIPLSAGQVGTYEVPASSIDKIYEILLCNTHSAAVTINLWRVPSGGSRQASTKLFDAQSLVLSAGETKILGLEQRFLAGTQLHGEASVDAVVSIHMAGDRIV